MATKLTLIVSVDPPPQTCKNCNFASTFLSRWASCVAQSFKKVSVLYVYFNSADEAVIHHNIFGRLVFGASKVESSISPSPRRLVHSWPLENFPGTQRARNFSSSFPYDDDETLQA